MYKVYKNILHVSIGPEILVCTRSPGYPNTVKEVVYHNIIFYYCIMLCNIGTGTDSCDL